MQPLSRDQAYFWLAVALWWAAGLSYGPLAGLIAVYGIWQWRRCDRLQLASLGAVIGLGTRYLLFIVFRLIDGPGGSALAYSWTPSFLGCLAAGALTGELRYHALRNEPILELARTMAGVAAKGAAASREAIDAIPENTKVRVRRGAEYLILVALLCAWFASFFLDAGIGRGYDAFLQSIAAMIYAILYAVFGKLPVAWFAYGLLLGSLWVANLLMVFAPITLKRARGGSTGGDLFVMAAWSVMIGVYLTLMVRSERALPTGLIVWAGSIVGMTIFLIGVRATSHPARER